MDKCDTCGNAYDKPLTVSRGTETRVFDSFECAIEAMAPRCEHCGCRIIGHGVEASERQFCCGHCAREAGIDSSTVRA